MLEYKPKLFRHSRYESLEKCTRASSSLIKIRELDANGCIKSILGTLIGHDNSCRAYIMFIIKPSDEIV